MAKGVFTSKILFAYYVHKKIKLIKYLSILKVNVKLCNKITAGIETIL